MLFYEIEPLGFPKYLRGFTVEVENYHNEFENIEHYFELSLIHQGRILFTYPDGHEEIVSPTTLLPSFSDADFHTKCYNGEWQKHDTIVCFFPYRHRLRDSEDTGDYAEIKQRVKAGQLMLIPFHESMGEKYGLLTQKMKMYITNLASPNPPDTLRAISTLYSICSLLTEFVIEHLDKTHRVAAPSSRRYISKAKDYIAAHYNEPLKAETIAAQLGISEGYLRNLFEQVMSTGIMNYVNRYRMEQACILIDSTSLTLKEIAERVGISDASYMSRLFRKVIGVTYSEYKRRGSREVYNLTNTLKPQALPEELTGLP